jgi:hypothetical protein
MLAATRFHLSMYDFRLLAPPRAKNVFVAWTLPLTTCTIYTLAVQYVQKSFISWIKQHYEALWHSCLHSTALRHSNMLLPAFAVTWCALLAVWGTVDTRYKPSASCLEFLLVVSVLVSYSEDPRIDPKRLRTTKKSVNKISHLDSGFLCYGSGSTW